MQKNNNVYSEYILQACGYSIYSIHIKCDLQLHVCTQELLHSQLSFRFLNFTKNTLYADVLRTCFPFLFSGGSTFCAVASLSLMGRLDSAFSPEERRGLARWCLRRQVTGFQGRPNKPSDTCYSFWIGASLEVLAVF